MNDRSITSYQYIIYASWMLKNIILPLMSVRNWWSKPVTHTLFHLKIKTRHCHLKPYVFSIQFSLMQWQTFHMWRRCNGSGPTLQGGPHLLAKLRVRNTRSVETHYIQDTPLASHFILTPSTQPLNQTNLHAAKPLYNGP